MISEIECERGWLPGTFAGLTAEQQSGLVALHKVRQDEAGEDRREAEQKQRVANRRR